MSPRTPTLAPARVDLRTPEPNLKTTLVTKKQPLTSERLDAFFEAVPRFIEPYRDRLLHWLASADRLCGHVAAGNSTYEQQALFVVRLAGILSDLLRRFKEPFLTPAEIAAADSRRN